MHVLLTVSSTSAALGCDVSLVGQEVPCPLVAGLIEDVGQSVKMVASVAC